MTFDKPIDLATGSYASVGAAGLVVRKKDGSFLVVRLDDKPTATDDDGSQFTHGQTALTDREGASMAYWVASGAVKRRLVSSDGTLGPLESVIDDASDGYPVFALRAGGADAVAYVAKKTSKDGERRARVWVEGKGSSDLSPSGSGATSLSLVERAPGAYAAVWLDGRSALAPIHAAELDVTTTPPSVSNEGVVWIAPPWELQAEVTTVRAGDTLVALVAQPKNGADFGLAAAPITFGAEPLNDAAWLDYPNGLDPAPAIPARFCGQPAIVLARPVARPVDAKKAVELATVEASGRVTIRQRIAEAGRIDHVSAWASPKGDGWVAWTGDGRTIVRRVRCK
jgi:hypothetical protein